MNESSASFRPYTIGAACITWFALALQCDLSLTLSVEKGQTLVEGLIRFLGFFTVLTNILVGLVLALPMLAPASKPGRFFASPFAVGGIAVSIAFVAISYHFLLRNVWNPQGAQLLADAMLHYIVPALFVAYWLIYFRTGQLRWAHSLAWSVYPTIYFVYVLAHGMFSRTYPYGFIDAGVLGYQQTLVNAFGLLFAFILLGSMFVAIDRTGRTARGVPDPG